MKAFMEESQKMKYVDMFTVKNGDTDVLVLRWAKENDEYGQVEIFQTGYEKIKINSEYMGKEFVREVLNFLVDHAEISG